MATNQFPEIKKVLNDSGRLLAETIADEAVQKGVYRTGALARSFRPLPLKEQDGKLSIKVEGIYYAPFQDQGTEYITARPFIQPGADRAIDGFIIPQLEAAGVKDIEDIIERNIETEFIKVQ